MTPLVMSPADFVHRRGRFAYFGSRLRVPHVLHEELRAKLGGSDADRRLMHWYDEVNAAADVSGEPIIDTFEWLRPKFKAWATDGGLGPQPTPRQLQHRLRTAEVKRLVLEEGLTPAEAAKRVGY